MGREYKIVCNSETIARLDEFLRNQPFFESYDDELRLFNLKIPGTKEAGDFPDGYASIEPDGIYFCDNLTAPDSASQILRRLIDQALLHSDEISIHEP